ncbi:MAG: amidohydrolase family protein, partial [Steroidobacteraceae bacterium]
MHRAVSILALLFSAAALGAVPAQPPQATRNVAIVGVTVVPMTGERTIEKATVVVTDGVISALGAERLVPVPTGSLVVRGNGKYLVPGLAEMHAHVPGAAAPKEYRDDVLFLYVANGVTLARGMLGAPEHLQLRTDLAAHRIVGPRLITSGPSLNGQSVKAPEQGERMVRDQKAAGYDFLKLHPGLSRDAFLAIARTAREVGIPFGGHVSADVGVPLALAEGQATIDHLDGYLFQLVPEADRGPSPDNMGLALKFDPALLPRIVRATRAAGTWIVPTQTLYDNIQGPATPDELDARPEMRYLSSQLRQQYRQRKQGVLDTKGWTPELANTFLDVRRQTIRALHDGGARILLGSDAPQVFNVPGFSAQRELQAMVLAGLTPYEALHAATAAPAEFFDAAGKYGTIVVGADADFVLVGANPLQDIGNLERIDGVMLRGRWLD